MQITGNLHQSLICICDPVAVINNHIKSFIELPNCQNASASSTGDMLNNVKKHHQALEALNKPFLSQSTR